MELVTSRELQPLIEDRQGATTCASPKLVRPSWPVNSATIVTSPLVAADRNQESEWRLIAPAPGHLTRSCGAPPTISAPAPAVVPAAAAATNCN